MIDYLGMIDNSLACHSTLEDCSFQGGFGQGNVGGYESPNGLNGYDEMNDLFHYSVDWYSGTYVSGNFFDAVICSSQAYLDPYGGYDYSCNYCSINTSHEEFCASTANYAMSYNAFKLAAQVENDMGGSGPCSSNSGTYFGALLGGSYNSYTVIEASFDGTNFHPIYNWDMRSHVNSPYSLTPVSPDGEQAFYTYGS